MRTWFNTWDPDGEKEMILLQDGTFIDSGVPVELVDKVLLWNKTCLPHFYPNTFAWFQRQLIARFFSDFNEYMAAPRGFSKTTTLQGCMMFAIVNRLEAFIVFIEKTLDEASEVLSTVKNEFLENKMIVAMYGDLVGKDDNRSMILAGRDPSHKDSRDDTFINGIRLRAKGWDQSPRGLKSREHRPSLIVMDDVEKDKHVDSEYQRDKYMRWFNRSVVPALDIDGNIKVFGTILHEDSMLAHLIRLHNGIIFRAWYMLDDPEFDFMDLPLHMDMQDDTIRKVLWSDRWPWPVLKSKVADMIDKNLSTKDSEQELRNMPVSALDAVFKRDQIRRVDRYITMEELQALKRTFSGFCTIDVADSTKETSDWTGVIVWLIDNEGNRYRVDVRRERRDILGQIQLIFEVWTKWVPFGLQKIGIEKTSFQDVIYPLFKEECRKRSIFPVIDELKPMGRRKEARIAGALSGMYEQGKIWTLGERRESKDERTGEDVEVFIPVGDTKSLWNELEKFPRAEHDDLSDAEAYLPEIVEVPFKEERTQYMHHDPIADPYQEQIKPRQSKVDDLFAEYGTIKQPSLSGDPYI